MVKNFKVKKYVRSSKQVKEDKEQRLTITKSLTPYQAYLKNNLMAKSTIEGYSRDVKQFKAILKNSFNDRIRYLDQIKTSHIREYQNHLLRELSTGKYKGSTVKRKIKALKSYYTFLNEAYELPNLMKVANINKRLEAASWKVKNNYFTDEELERLFSYIENLKEDVNYRDRAMIYFLYYTGCRRSEMLSIKWVDIDLQQETVRIFREKTKNEDGVLLHKKAIAEILKYAEIYGYGSEYVFPKPSDKSKPFDGNSFYDRFKRILRDVGGIREDLSPHSMRHTFVTKSKKAGVMDLATISFTGHTRVTGLAPYTHIDVEDKKKVFDALELKKVS